ncbi:hypothetical protein [Muricoccus aerilatus]|uniref:hypothetical protein n=1 Tax=Muricoccus aerilatus TaxID=452982 RepID=UPI0005C172D7|nr:hypothetical protein [Roseomonas aerilata]
MSDRPDGKRAPAPDTSVTHVDPIQDNPLARRQAHGRMAEERGDDPAAGTAAEPVAPGEFQAGDRSELGQILGGPVDISPIRGRRAIERPEE